MRSGDTVTTAEPFGQPDPFADTTPMVIQSGGGGGAAGTPRDVSIMAPAVIALNMVCLPKCSKKSHGIAPLKTYFSAVRQRRR
ncbi:hypothetical protein GCM10009828_079070 [Actinoplanes couchii]